MYGAGAVAKMLTLEEELDRTFESVGQRERPRLVSMNSKGKIEKRSAFA